MMTKPVLPQTSQEGFRGRSIFRKFAVGRFRSGAPLKAFIHGAPANPRAQPVRVGGIGANGAAEMAPPPLAIQSLAKRTTCKVVRSRH